MGRSKALDQRFISLYGWRAKQPIGGRRADLYEPVAGESCPLFILLRHRTPSSPIYLSEVIHKPLALSRVFLLFSGGKSVLLVKKKAPSRSRFPLSMHVALKTRYVNPISTYVDIRATYVVQTYLPRVHNFYPYTKQQPNIGHFTKLRPLRRLAKWSIGIGSFIGCLIALLALLLYTGVIRVYGLTTGYNQLPKEQQGRVVFSQGCLTDLDKAQ